MSCCGQDSNTNEYKLMSNRLLDFGKEVYSTTDFKKYEYTKLWVFTFYDEIESCNDCKHQLSEMNNWFNSYNFFNDPIKNVKWVIEDEPDKNKIFINLGINKKPLHIFCDESGKIIDIITGFPTKWWLEKFILHIMVN